MINQPIVHVKNNQVFANSQDVAAYFGKDHSNVLRDLREIASNLKTSQFNEMYFDDFRPDSYGRMQNAIGMTQKGFTLLVMGYTGKKAMEFKLKYIERFEEMEEQLRNQQPQLPDFSDPSRFGLARL